MKAILLTNGSPNQAALYYKLRESCTIERVVISQNIGTDRSALQATQLRMHAISGRMIGSPFRDAWLRLQSRYAHELGPIPDGECELVDDINDALVIDLIREVRPHIVLVSGVHPIGNRLIERCADFGGMINLHTGIAPYMMGGPNCTNWCLATGEVHLIGNTVMWLDTSAGGGPLIATEQTPLVGDEDLRELHWKVMQHGHDLFRRVATSLALGRKLPRIEQDTLPYGQWFKDVDWNAFSMVRALRNFRRTYGPAYFRSAAFQRATTGVRLFPWVEPSAEAGLQAAMYKATYRLTTRSKPMHAAVGGDRAPANNRSNTRQS